MQVSEEVKQFAEKVAQRLIAEARRADMLCGGYESPGLRVAAQIVREEATDTVELEEL